MRVRTNNGKGAQAVGNAGKKGKKKSPSGIGTLPSFVDRRLVGMFRLGNEGLDERKRKATITNIELGSLDNEEDGSVGGSANQSQRGGVDTINYATGGPV